MAAIHSPSRNTVAGNTVKRKLPTRLGRNIMRRSFSDRAPSPCSALRRQSPIVLGAERRRYDEKTGTHPPVRKQDESAQSDKVEDWASGELVRPRRQLFDNDG